MTKAEWLAGMDPTPMLDFLCGRGSNRKFRLALCAECRRFWTDINQDQFRQAIEVGELMAEGMATSEAIQEASRAAHSRVGLGAKACRLCVHPDAVLAARDGLDAACAATAPILLVRGDYAEHKKRDKARQTILLRDIFGNPFHPVAFSPSWRTDTAVALALHMYESRDFAAMPILADALQDAGCDNPDILNHCRDETAGGGSGEPAGGSSAQGGHVRGCWVVDLVLGKE